MNEDLYRRISNAIASMPYGWCTQLKAETMANAILENKPKLFVEIGVYGGKSLIPCAMALESAGEGVAVGIDPWAIDAAIEGDSDIANREWWATAGGGNHLRDAKKSAEESINRFHLQHRCFLIEGRAENVVNIFSPESVDMLHIDGNHTELSSVRDVNLWLPRVRKGGIIWFDDINWATCGKALSILGEKCTKLGEIIGEHTAVGFYRV